MGAPVKTVKSLPPQAQSTALKLAMTGFREGMWTYVPNHDLANPGMGIQVRDDDDRAPKKMVAHYAEMMKPFLVNRDQLPMPPVVFTRDGYLVDGWTRTEAARRLGWMTYPAIVFNDTWNGAAEVLKDMFVMAGTLLNVSHGKGLSTANLERVVLAVAEGQDLTSPGAVADLARKMQCSRTMISNLLCARDARERAEFLGVDLSDAPALTRTHLTNMGIWHDRLTNPVFKAFLELTVTGKLSTNEQRALFVQLVKLDTERERLGVIAAEAASRAGMTSGYHGRPPQSAQLRQAAGKFLKFRDTPGRAVEISPEPETRANHVKVLEETLGVIRKILVEQYNHDSKQPAEQG